MKAFKESGHRTLSLLSPERTGIALLKTACLKLLLLFGLVLTGSVALADPPARVGSIAYLQGEVEFRTTYDAESAPALPNWPLTSGNVIRTGPGARAELRVGSTALRLDAGSELEIAELDDQILRLRLLQGGLNARVKNPDLAAGFELSTAQGRLMLSAPSQLRADAGRPPGTTIVNLFSGAARVDSGVFSSTLMLAAGQRALLADGQVQVGAATRDDFDQWSLARDQRDDQSVSARYVSPELTGYEVLDQYGAWSISDDYGAVWIPQNLPADWAPYRDGRWTWIEPWGWTWIDTAPWGYAPFHYGRWAWFRQRWCWVPGRVVARPVWAPALVGWVGSDNWNARFSAGSAPAVGWFPLAPHQDFRPGYAASPAYTRRLNEPYTGRGSRPDFQAIYRERLEHNAVTVIPHERFEQRRSIAVGRAPALVGAPQQLGSAPLSATMPATLARPPLAVTPRAIPEQRREPPVPAPLAAPAPVRSPEPTVPPVQRFGSAPQPFEQRREAAPRTQPLRAPHNAPLAPAAPEQRAPIGIAPRPHPEQPPAPSSPQSEQRSAPGRAGLALPPPAGQGQRFERAAPADAGRPRQFENRSREGERPARGDTSGNR